jgi:dihydrolipoamide dehydrogenase
MSDEMNDLIVIGAGPGGYVAAIRASQLGMKVAVVERMERLGGVCLNEGCIPSKALLDSSEFFALARNKFALHGIDIDPPSLNLSKMMARKDDVVKKLTDGVAYLFKKNGITRVSGTARLGASGGAGRHTVEVTADSGEKQILSGKNVLLATGSEAIQVPGFTFDGELVVNARDALAFQSVPEHLLVVGGGYIGLELGSVWLRLGSRVTVVEMLPNILPNTDRQVAETLRRSLLKQGMTFKLGTKVVSWEKQGDKAVVRVEKEGAQEDISCDRILVAVGRRPLTADIAPEKAGIALDGARIKVDENFATSVPGIYAIGDLIHGPMLAHKAMTEGEVFAERLVGQASVVDYEFVPGIIYTWPEAASVGKTEEQLQAKNIPYAAGRFNFMANGRAKCMDETEGFVKVLAHKETGRVLGIHIIGPRASDMIAEAVTVMTYGGTAEDIALTFHAHPTLSEAVKEAALDVEKRAIHA